MTEDLAAATPITAHQRPTTGGDTPPARTVTPPAADSAAPTTKVDPLDTEITPPTAGAASPGDEIAPPAAEGAPPADEGAPRGGRVALLAGTTLRRSWPLPVLAMTVLGMFRLGTPVLWQDELVTVNVATRSLRQVLDLAKVVDAVHATYYLFMFGWIRVFGDSPVALRLPSALAMVATAACVALIGRRLFDPTAGLLAGLIFAVVPSVTRYAQEARSYALLSLTAALATLLLLRAIERSTWLRWAGYALCITAIAMMSPVAFTIVFGHGVAVLAWPGDTWRRRGPLWRGRPGLLARLVLAVLVGALPAVPVVRLGIEQSATQIGWIHLDPLWDVWPNAFNSAPVAWTVVALAVLAWARRWRSAAVATALAVTPVVVIWLVSLGGTTYFFGKYLMFLIPLWSVLAGAGLAAVRLPRRSPTAAARSRVGRALAAGGLTVAQVLALGAVAAAALPAQQVVRGTVRHAWFTYPQPQDNSSISFDYRGAAQVIARGYRPGDAIAYPRVFWWSMFDIGVGYYLPPSVHPRDVFLERTAAQATATHATECPVAEACIGDERRVWVVAPTKWSAYGAVPLMMFTHDQIAAMDRHYRPTSKTFVNGLTVVLFQRVA